MKINSDLPVDALSGGSGEPGKTGPAGRGDGVSFSSSLQDSQRRLESRTGESRTGQSRTTSGTMEERSARVADAAETERVDRGDGENDNSMAGNSLPVSGQPVPLQDGVEDDEPASAVRKSLDAGKEPVSVTTGDEGLFRFGQRSEISAVNEPDPDPGSEGIAGVPDTGTGIPAGAPLQAVNGAQGADQGVAEITSGPAGSGGARDRMQGFLREPGSAAGTSAGPSPMTPGTTDDVITGARPVPADSPNLLKNAKTRERGDVLKSASVLPGLARPGLTRPGLDSPDSSAMQTVRSELTGEFAGKMALLVPENALAAESSSLSRSFLSPDDGSTEFLNPLNGPGQASGLVSASPGALDDNGLARKLVFAVNHPPGSAAFDREVGNQVRWMVSHERQVAELRLNPPSLGVLEIRVVTDEDKTRVTLYAQNAQTREMMEQGLPRLRDLLASSGVVLGETEVSDQAPGERRDHGELPRTSGFREEPGANPVARAPVNVRLPTGLVDTFI